MNARLIKLCSSLFQNFLSKRAYISMCIAGCMMSIALGRENIENQIDQKQEIASYILPEVMVTDLGIVGRGEGNKRYQSTKLATCARFM